MLETKTVSEIINHIKSKDLSIKEVIEYYLNNIEKLNPKINSIVSIKSKNKIIEDFMIIEMGQTLDCFDLCRTSNNFNTKVLSNNMKRFMVIGK